jgi:drug/metabolite transporter (DMT)-like permease
MPSSASAAESRPALAGIGFLLVTVLGWGLNWPVMKLILAELPPVAARGASCVAAAVLLTLGARLAGESLAVPREAWGRLALASLCNVSAWMGLVSLGLLWLPAGEGAIVAYTMPVWTALMAWPVLGERPTPRRMAALAMGIAGLLLLMAGPGLVPDTAKLPGVLVILAGALGFAFGTVRMKRRPLLLPPLSLVAWQVALGAIPMIAFAALFERPDFSAVSGRVWLAMGYGTLVPLCLCYLCWFAALRRLPAGAASLGTLLTPVVGVLASAAALGEPFTWRIGVALGLTVGGIALAIRG